MAVLLAICAAIAAVVGTIGVARLASSTDLAETAGGVFGLGAAMAVRWALGLPPLATGTGDLLGYLLAVVVFFALARGARPDARAEVRW